MHQLPGFVALFALVASVAFAQSTADTAVALENTPIYVVADATRTPLRVAAQGTVFRVLQEDGDWTRVQFTDPQWGQRVGYVHTKALRFSRPDLAPMDLSVREPASGPSPLEESRMSPQRIAAPAQPMQARFDRAWPRSYVVGRSGVTFGTRTAPLAGVEFGSHVASMLQVYATFDWHRDVAPQFLADVFEGLSDVADVDVDARLPAYVATGGVKVIAPRGTIRPYALAGFGVGQINGTIEFDGEDVTEFLDEVGVLNRDDLKATKPVFEFGGGIAMSRGPVYVDVGYRFRKPFDTSEPFNVSGIYAGVGVAF
jgi:opacity protein-like surface antigen